MSESSMHPCGYMLHFVMGSTELQGVYYPGTFYLPAPRSSPSPTASYRRPDIRTLVAGSDVNVE